MPAESFDALPGLTLLAELEAGSSDARLLAEHAALLAQGRYAAAGLQLRSQPEAVQRRPDIALALGRALQLQGLRWQADAAYAAASNPTPAQRLQLSMQRTLLAPYLADHLGEALRGALHGANRLVREGEALLAAQRTDLAMLKVAHARVRMLAATFNEAPDAAAEHAEQELIQQAAVLDQGGNSFAAWSARSSAQLAGATQCSFEAAGSFASEAKAAGQLGIAAATHISAARAAMSVGAVHGRDASIGAVQELVGDLEGERWELDLQAIRAIGRVAGGSPDIMVACIDAYAEAQWPADAGALAQTEASLALQHGHFGACERFCERAAQLAVTAGGRGVTGPFIALLRMAMAHRTSNPGLVVQLGSQALHAGPRLATGQQFLLVRLLSTSCSEVPHLAGKAAAWAQQARELAEASSAAGNTALVLQLEADAADATSTAEAQLLSLRRAAEDACAAASKQHEPLLKAELLQGAQSALDRAEGLLGQQGWQGVRSVNHQGRLLQTRALLLNLAGRGGGVDCLEEASRLFLTVDMWPEAADCNYAIGIHLLKDAEQQATLPAAADAAATQLQRALPLYERAGQRRHMARAHTMLAHLHVLIFKSVNAAAIDSRAAVRQGAMLHLVAAEGLYNDLRRDFAAGSTAEVQLGKVALLEGSQQVYQLGLNVLLLDGQWDAAWDWAQRAKSRALSDMIGSATNPPAALLTALPAAEAELAQAELALARRERAAAQGKELESVAALQRRRRQAWQAMEARRDDCAPLADYLDFTSGSAVQVADLPALAERIGRGSSWAAVDWIAVGDQLWLSVKRHLPAGEEPARMLPLGVSLKLAAERVAVWRPGRFERLKRRPGDLDEDFGDLVAPLAGLTQPGEVLVLSPTAALHSVPLHALAVGGCRLLLRNPCVYNPSLSVLRQCATRSSPAQRAAAAQHGVSIVADPRRNLPGAAAAGERLRNELHAPLLLGSEATCEAFWAAARGNAVLVFVGHAAFRHNDPLESCLQLSDGEVTAGAVLEHAHAVRFLVLAGCQSGAQHVLGGDELRGLQAAFMYSGADAVVSTLWETEVKSTVQIVQGFVAALRDEDAPRLDKARALQQAVRLWLKSSGEGELKSLYKTVLDEELTPDDDETMAAGADEEEAPDADLAPHEEHAAGALHNVADWAAPAHFGQRRGRRVVITQLEAYPASQHPQATGRPATAIALGCEFQTGGGAGDFSDADIVIKLPAQHVVVQLAPKAVKGQATEVTRTASGSLTLGVQQGGAQAAAQVQYSRGRSWTLHTCALSAAGTGTQTASFGWQEPAPKQGITPDNVLWLVMGGHPPNAESMVVNLDVQVHARSARGKSCYINKDVNLLLLAP